MMDQESVGVYRDLSSVPGFGAGFCRFHRLPSLEDLSEMRADFSAQADRHPEVFYDSGI